MRIDASTVVAGVLPVAVRWADVRVDAANALPGRVPAVLPAGGVEG